MAQVMLDLETMGNGPSAAIVAIGAVSFSVEGGVLDEFYKAVSLETSVLAGGVMDPSTVLWWLQQSNEAREQLFKQSSTIELALAEFKEWLPQGAKVWGNGAAFDNVILASACRRLNLDAPWKHWEDRCYRTMKAMYRSIPSVKPEVPHHALYDAKAQAEHLINIAREYKLELT